MSAHTPGPWTALRWWEDAGIPLDQLDPDDREQEAAAKVIRVVGANGETVCAAHDLAYMTQEDGALIAAAPLMRDTLRLALRTMGAKGGPTAGERDAAMASIRHALRTAEPVKKDS